MNIHYSLLLSHSLCRSFPLSPIFSLCLLLATISLSLTLCPDTLMWHLTPAEGSPLPPFHLSDQCSLFLFTRHRPSEKGLVQRDNPPQARSLSLGLSALNGTSVWQALRRPSPQTVWHVWSPGPGVQEEYSALSAPKSSLFNGTSQTEMVFRKHNVCATFWQACEVSMTKKKKFHPSENVDREQSFLMQTINLWKVSAMGTNGMRF